MSERLRVVFVLRSLGYLRFFRPSFEQLVERGHDVRLLLSTADHGEPEQRWLDRMAERPGFSVEVDPHGLPTHRNTLHVRLRRTLEYLYYLQPGERNRALLRMRIKDAPRFVRRLTRLPPLRGTAALRGFYRLVAALDRAMPVPPAVTQFVERSRPDVLAVADPGGIRSVYSVYVAAAKRAGVPVASCVASWDNLTTRQLLREVPDALLVWNDRQVEEAVEIHRVPRERVVTTGAPHFDDWFAWTPRPREAFLARVGLDPSRPFVLWVGGALFEYESPRTEAEYAREWLEALRSADEPELREVGVLFRPHPSRLESWQAVDLADGANAAVWPRAGMTFPIDDEAKADYYDSIYHAAAVVGLNSSAMIEATIVGRPVVGVVAPEFHDSQLGAAHFAYLLDASGGVVRVEATREQQFAALARVLAGIDEGADARRRFVRDFVRPHGLERPATEVFVDALERVARLPVAPAAEPLWLRLLRAPLARIAARVDARALQ
jgi:hypothetical protein